METQRLAQQVRVLQLELAKANAEAARLRKRLEQNTRHHKRIERAYEDALLLAFWRSAGIMPSRRFAALYQITQNRWQNAVALLRMARLIQSRSRWSAFDLDTMEQRLAQARQRALADPELFFLRLNRHGRR